MLSLIKCFPCSLPSTSLRLVENLPQVGSFVLDYNFNEEDNIFDGIDDSKIYDYIINKDYEMIIGRGHYKMNKKGKDLISAGRLIINNKIEYIDNDSGHYNPPKNHLLEIIDYFKSVDLLSDNFKFKDIDNQL